MGRIELIIGCMYSGKTTDFMRRVMMYKTLNRKMIIITHSSDTRYTDAGYIANHNYEKMKAKHTTKLFDLSNNNEYVEASVVFIEEAQFFPDLFEFVLNAANNDDKTVIISGLDGDFQLAPFEQVVKLIPHAESVTKLTALCKRCGDGTPACFSKRLVKCTERELVGSEGVYTAVCRKHYYND
jgi:thymidine kinase